MMKYSLCILALTLAVFVQFSFQQGPGYTGPAIPAEVTAFSASRLQRHGHSFFHNTRMSYLAIGKNQQHALAKLGWRPPRPAKAWRGENGATEIVLDGDAGEDFLFMHRKMIEEVNQIAQDAGSEWRVVGWTECPAPGDDRWPVPPVYTIPGNEALTNFITYTKTDGYYWSTIEPMERWLENSDNLRSLTLGQLGVKLEFEIHTWFHLRFSAESSLGYREQSANPTDEIDVSWDAPAYDFLADFYSAHVNPYFWKIHGWIEKKIEAWRVANHISKIHWAGTWEGGPLTNDIILDLNAAALVTEDPVEVPETPDPAETSEEQTFAEETFEALVKIMLEASRKRD